MEPVATHNTIKYCVLPVAAGLLLVVDELDRLEVVVLTAVVVADVVAGFDEVTLEAVLVAAPGTHWSEPSRRQVVRLLTARRVSFVRTYNSKHSGTGSRSRKRNRQWL